MASNKVLLTLAAAVALGCAESVTPPTAASDGLSLQASAGGGVVHQAIAGSPDICTGNGSQPGCDANFSLVAVQRADGSTTGQWVDRFSQVNGGGGVHVTLDCLNVIGNQAWVSGVVTQSVNSDEVGLDAITTVRDNGSSVNEPPDQLFITVIGAGIDCFDGPSFDVPLFGAPQGQVVVR